MFIYLLIGLITLAFIAVSMKDIWKDEEFTHSDICIEAIVMLGCGMFWPLFIAYVAITIYKGR